MIDAEIGAVVPAPATVPAVLTGPAKGLMHPEELSLAGVSALTDKSESRKRGGENGNLTVHHLPLRVRPGPIVVGRVEFRQAASLVSGSSYAQFTSAA